MCGAGGAWSDSSFVSPNSGLGRLHVFGRDVAYQVLTGDIAIEAHIKGDKHQQNLRAWQLGLAL